MKDKTRLVHHVLSETLFLSSDFLFLFFVCFFVCFCVHVNALSK